MIEEELIRISNMDEHQILLKVRNLKRHSSMSKQDHTKLCNAVELKLLDYGYRLECACCGTYRAEKI